MALVVVVLGAYTRLVDAGLGCPDWPTCYGHLWIPDSVEEIETANLKFKDTPVETDKTWPEQVHRIFASSLGLIILIFFYFVLKKETAEKSIKYINTVSIFLIALVLATIVRIFVGDTFEPVVGLIVFAYFLNIGRLWRGSSRPSSLFLLTSVLAGLVIVQGLFGMWTVTLKLWPQVVTGHLLGGFATISLIALIWSLLLSPKYSIFVKPNGMAKKLILASFVIVVIQITLGGWTTSNYAALACPELPTCQSYWFPKADFVEGFNIFQHVGPNYLGGKLDNDARVAIHLSHRIGAVLTCFIVVLLIIALFKEASSLPAKNRITQRLYALGLAGTLFVQLSLGVSNILFALPLTVAVAHNAVGALLLALVFIALYRKRDIS